MKNKNKKIADTVAGPAAPGDDENSGREKNKKLSKIKKEAKKEALNGLFPQRTESALRSF